jgi:hypothetical protein
MGEIKGKACVEMGRHCAVDQMEKAVGNNTGWRLINSGLWPLSGIHMPHLNCYVRFIVLYSLNLWRVHFSLSYRLFHSGIVSRVNCAIHIHHVMESRRGDQTERYKDRLLLKVISDQKYN